MKKWREHAWGTLTCVVAAGALAFVFRGSKVEHFLPLLFIAAIGVVADRFGSAAGILGTVGAAIIFAEFLFPPTLSLRVSDSLQRNNLLWMVVIGTIISELLGAQRHKPHRGDRKGISGI